MRSTPLPPRYPLDRYLVDNNKKIEMVNIIDDEIWNPEPALKPEDEMILRKLHEMLQSTAQDLKLLSGELSKCHEPNVLVKTMPTPLDEEFNERVHIQELVDAKFHGHKIVEKTSIPLQPSFDRSKADCDVKVNTAIKTKAASQNKSIPRKNLGISRTRIVQINETKDKKVANNKNPYDYKESNRDPIAAYKEISYHEHNPIKPLDIQEMPSVNIRSELKTQKVFQIDIFPSSELVNQDTDSKVNVAVITIQHKPESVSKPTTLNKIVDPRPDFYFNKQPTRKLSKMSAYESSESTNNISSENIRKIFNKQKRRMNSSKNIPKHSVNDHSKTLKYNRSNGKSFNIDEWKRKLGVIYSQSSNVKQNKLLKSGSTSKKLDFAAHPSTSKQQSTLPNNAEYIPYSQLTLGGIKVSDIEKEISDLPNKSDIPLSPILDKILSSCENSFRNEIPKTKYKKKNNKILSKSDENLLQEVIDIEKKVSKSLTRIVDKVDENSFVSNISNDKNESYADDFEDSKSDNYSQKRVHTDDDNNNNSDDDLEKSRPSNKNTTYIKSPNLSFKNTVDIHEYVHSIDTQEIAVQSNASQKISPKETQTSPRNDTSSIQPIHNDLWPSSDPLREIEKMFKLEKDFIKKMIVEEYGDLIEANITKPSTSKDNNENNDNVKNIANFQKNTQTSPARVKNTMTSPRKTKTRTTSPFMLSLTVDRQTSPLTNEDNLKVEIENNAEDLGISINLSSPRFTLRLPQTSREVISNLEACSQSSLPCKDNSLARSKTSFRKIISSSSSAEIEDSSDISSLGEVNLKLKSKLRSRKNPSISTSSSVTSVSRWDSSLDSGGILPLRSEGEASLGQTARNFKKSGKSDGEVNNAKV